MNLGTPRPPASLPTRDRCPSPGPATVRSCRSLLSDGRSASLVGSFRLGVGWGVPLFGLLIIDQVII